MKSFKEFLTESGTHGVPVISTDKNNADLKIKSTIDELNRSLLQVSGVGFVNPYNALEKISKVVSSYGLNIPRINSLSEPGGRVIIEFSQFGNHTGYVPKFNQVVNGIQTNSGPVPPQGSSNSDPKHYLYFAWQMNEDSVYDCYAVVMDQEGVNGVFESVKLDEIAPKTLGKYVKKASGELLKRGYYHGKHDNGKGTQKDLDTNVHMMNKRADGISGAMDRLTNSGKFKSYNR